MVDWRTPETALIDSSDRLTLGRLSREILGTECLRVDQTMWRGRPLLTAIGVRRFRNDSVTLSELLTALNSATRTSLDVLGLTDSFQHAHLLEMPIDQNIYWGDASRVDSYIRKKQLDLAYMVDNLDQLIALTVFEQVTHLDLWDEIGEAGLSQEALTTLRKLAREE
ncbi:MAG: hypothetical protein P1U64_11850 [Alcanivoracaceae bacterium]|nr:hypothetical protein [Alcanivoracaceae bacterium]